MKRQILIIATILIVCSGYLACNEHETIYFTDLPATAQAFLQKYFPDNLVASAERHDEEPLFEVRLDNGYEIDFYSDGRWQEIDSKAAIYLHNSYRVYFPRRYATISKRTILWPE